MDMSGLNLESERRTDDMESLYPGSSGIYRKHIALIVTHHLQDMGMAADKKIRMMKVYQSAGAGIISSGIAADMGHEDFHPFAFKDAMKRMDEPETMVVAISGDAFQGLECRNLFGQLHAAAEISGMPYLIDRFEEFAELPVKDSVGI